MEKNTQRMSDKEMNNAGMKRPTCASIGSNDCQCCNRRNSHSLTNGSVLESKVGWGLYLLGCKCSICSLYICSARKNAAKSRIIRSKEIKYKHHLVFHLDIKLRDLQFRTAINPWWTSLPGSSIFYDTPLESTWNLCIILYYMCCTM